MIAICEKIDKDLTVAMKTAENKEEVSVLRMLKSAIKNKEIEKGESLSDEDTVELLAKEYKKRNESAEIYEKAGRSELAQKEKEESVIISRYLPEQLSEKDIDKAIDEVISELGATDMKDSGKVMSAVMSKFKGRVQGGEVLKKVQEKLAG